MQPVNDLSRSLVALEQDSTLIVAIEMSWGSWLVGGLVPGVARDPLKKLAPDPRELLKLMHRWRDEAARAGRPIARIVAAYEAGRDGFWLARWLTARGVEVQVIHPTSIPVSREHRRAKTDRLDVGLLKRALLGWLRGEKGHCQMAAIPTVEEEDARRPSRERERLVREITRLKNRLGSALARWGIRDFNPKLRGAAAKLEGLRTAEGEPLAANTLAELRRDLERLALARSQIRELEAARLERLERAPAEGANLMVQALAKVVGVGVETADMLVREVLGRDLRDRRAVARFAGLTGSPDESGYRRREKGLSRAGSARVRRGMIQLAWRFIKHQPMSALANWWRKVAQGASAKVRKTMIVALARKLLIALWRLARTGEVPQGVRLHPVPIAA
jgi:transposase